MQDDEPSSDAELERALDAWSPQLPPAGFAERVVAARDATAPTQHPGRRRALVISGLAMVGAAAAITTIVLRTPARADSGVVVAAQRMTAVLGDRGVAVVEPASELAWRIVDSGAAELNQRTGSVFYRVERGEPFVVHTPAGDVRVTGTCFRIEVTPMTPNHKLLIAGLAGAALATTVLVTVYEGHVIAETRTAKAELIAGSRATLRGDDASILTEAVLATPGVDPHATHDELIARNRAQQAELHRLRVRIGQLERTPPPVESEDNDAPEPGRPWHEPSPELLASWVAECKVRTDQPSLDQFSPLGEPDPGLGIRADELPGYNAAMTAMAKRWRDLVRGLYVEVTGDAAGADALSSRAMRNEIHDKSLPGEYNQILQRLARERAGLAAAPDDLGKATALERLTRAYVELGDQSEAALARQIGAERAHAIRGNGWSSRHEMSGCPSGAPAP